LQSGLLGLRFVMETHPPCFCLICGSCSSARSFASGFLQIPPRGGHPCFWPTLPTAIRVADFHRQVTAHAGRTKTPAPRMARSDQKCGIKNSCNVVIRQQHLLCYICYNLNKTQRGQRGAAKILWGSPAEQTRKEMLAVKVE